MKYNRIRIVLALVFLLTMLYQVKDIILGDFKIILFICLLIALFGIIYYFSFTIFNKRNKYDD